MAWVHNLSPFAIQFSETFGIRWYGLAYLSGFVGGYLALLLMTRKGRTRFQEAQLADFVTYTAMGVLIGGRLGYALFYSPDLFTSWDSHFPFWGVLKVNEGGMASHGGILGVMGVCYIYARRNKMPFWHVLDLTVFGSAIGFFFGRLANFVNGELYGREAPEGFRWAVKFPSEMLAWLSDDSPKLQSLGPAAEAMGSFQSSAGQIVTVSAESWAKWVTDSARGDGLARQQVYGVVEALIAAVQSGQTRVIEALAPVLTARYPSQLYQALLEGLIVFLLMVWIWRKPQKTGVMAGWFGTLYCAARIIGEQFRLPDAHIGYQWLGLTRGQWLSVGLLLVAVSWLIYAYRRPAERLGGWADFKED